jgi:hypothetical protein
MHNQSNLVTTQKNDYENTHKKHGKLQVPRQGRTDTFRHGN